MLMYVYIRTYMYMFNESGQKYNLKLQLQSNEFCLTAHNLMAVYVYYNHTSKRLFSSVRTYKPV